MTGSLDLVERKVRGWLEEGVSPFVVGICGAQGSGKSTLSEGLAGRLTLTGLKVAILSLDDLYLPASARPVGLSPLFATRGVPGTHDVALGERVFTGLKASKTTRLPRFDKAIDSPAAVEDWPEITAPDVIIFEGWCVGARPEAPDRLMTPLNALERQDEGGSWRQAVNAALGGGYAHLFGHIDRLVLLSAPSFEVVRDWRIEQEHSLRSRLRQEGREGSKVMSDDDIAIFVQHYQRLTEHILRTMPGYADLTLRLDAKRQLIGHPD